MKSTESSVQGIILAAGASRRIGSPKALLLYRGRTFLERMIDALGTSATSITVVTAPGADGIQIICEQYGVATVINPAPERGMLTSLQCALAQCDAGAYLFTPVDYPAIQRATIAAMVDLFRSERAEAVIPEFHGRHGHPVCISRAIAERILELPEGASARDAIHEAPVRYLPVDDPGILFDVDTPAEYEMLAAGERP